MSKATENNVAITLMYTELEVKATKNSNIRYNFKPRPLHVIKWDRVQISNLEPLTIIVINKGVLNVLVTQLPLQ